MAGIMSWTEIREAFPDTFVLLDKCKQKEAENRTVILGGRVLFTTNDGKVIYEKYRRRAKSSQDVVFGHTTWPIFEIEHLTFLGIRPSA